MSLAANDVNAQQSTSVSENLTANHTDDLQRNTSVSASQTLDGFKRWRRQVTSAESVSSVSNNVHRRCDEVLSHSEPVRCENVLNGRDHDHTQLISNHFCVNCKQLMVNFNVCTYHKMDFISLLGFTIAASTQWLLLWILTWTTHGLIPTDIHQRRSHLCRQNGQNIY